MCNFTVSCDAEGGIASHGAAVCECTLHSHHRTDPGSVSLLQVNSYVYVWHTCIHIYMSWKALVWRNMFRYVQIEHTAKKQKQQKKQNKTVQHLIVPIHSHSEWVVLYWFLSTHCEDINRNMLDVSERCRQRKRLKEMVTDGQREVLSNAWHHMMCLS